MIVRSVASWWKCLLCWRARNWNARQIPDIIFYYLLPWYYHWQLTASLQLSCNFHPDALVTVALDNCRQVSMDISERATWQKQRVQLQRWLLRSHWNVQWVHECEHWTGLSHSEKDSGLYLPLVCYGSNSLFPQRSTSDWLFSSIIHKTYLKSELFY